MPGGSGRSWHERAPGPAGDNGATAAPGTGGKTLISQPRTSDLGQAGTLRARARFATAASLLTLLVVVSIALGACGSEEESNASTTATERDFARENFSDSTTIDNKWSPLVPGTQFVYEGRSNRGHGRRAHRVVFTVTDLTKEANGVSSVVLWDQDINAGELLEGELALFAQDDDGNLWNMGEFPAEFDEQGHFEGAPDTWVAGVEGATAGILMRGDPQMGTPSYHQGLAPKIGFQDLAKVSKTGQRNCVPTGCYDDVLVTDETNPTEPDDGHQLKFYAPGVGNIRAAPGKGGKEREVLVLVKVMKLSPKELASARREALALDRLAHGASKSVWGNTPPAERTLKAGRSS
jgi:hypothetical protein